MGNYAIPKRLSFDKTKKVLKGWYLSDADKEPVSSSKVKDRTGINEASRLNNFFVETDILDKDGRSYTLTPDGEELTKAISRNNEEKAKSLLGERIKESAAVDELLSYIEINEPLEKSEIKSYLVELVNADNSGQKTGVNTLIEMIEWSELIEKTDGGFKASRNIQDYEDVESTSKQDGEVDENQTSETVTRTSYQEENKLEVNLNLSGDEKPEDVKELIVAVREGLDEEIDTNE